MARGNMIVTLVAQTKKFQQGLKDAGGVAQKFGAVVSGAMSMALGALGLLAGAVFLFLPNFIKMGEESRKSELRLSNVAKQMGLFGGATEIVARRLSKYAEQLSYTTGIDDDLIKSSEALLLTFSNVANSANKTGGIFDRALVASLDLAATGFGNAESNAIQLGKALNDPVKGIGALGEAGVTFTQTEKDKIKELVKSNRLLEAQEIVMRAIEIQVGGTAAATASATDKMSARFESVAEELSLSLLPAVDDISGAMIDWLDSVEGKNTIKKLTDELIEFGEWIASPDGKEAIDDLAGSLEFLADVLVNITNFMKGFADAWKELADTTRNKVIIPLYEDYNIGPNPNPKPVTPNLPTVADRVNITVNGVVSGPATARTVLDALKEANRLGQR